MIFMRKLMLGLVVGLLIGMTGTAIASSNFIQAQYAKFNIQIDNNEVVEVEAVVVDGVSNYPIRVIMDLLGNEVDYVDKTRTIVVTTPIHEKGSEDLAEEEVTVIDESAVKPMPEYIPTDPESYTSIAAINDRLAVLEALHWAFGEVSAGVNYTAAQKKVAMEVVGPIAIEESGLKSRKQTLEYQIENADAIAEQELAKKINDLERRISRVIKSIETHERFIASSRASMKSNADSQWEGWEQYNAEIEQGIRDHETNIANLQAELADLQSQLAELQ